MAIWINNKRLAGNDIWRTEVRDPFAVKGDRGSGCYAVISAVIKACKNTVEISTPVLDQVPFAVELFGNALHERDIETGRAVAGNKFEWRVW